MRSVWNGTISFGLVNIPVGLCTATEKKDVSFRTLHRGCGEPIKQKRVCPVHDVEVPNEDVVKGYEVAKGHYVIVEPSELEGLGRLRSSTIEVEHFVRIEEVDPIYFDSSYYLAPGKVASHQRAYLTLAQAMADMGMGAIARFTAWNRDNLALIRPQGRTLVLHRLLYGEDVRTFMIEHGTDAEPIEAEVELATQLVSAKRAEFDPWEFANEYRESVRELIDAKVEGKEFTVEPPEAPAETPDLMAAMRAMVAEAKEEAKPKKSSKKTASKAA